jgi:hypothetical protein
MWLWLVCSVVLFGLFQGYDWVSQQSWLGLPDLGLPWLALSGLGLAIASNLSVWKSWSSYRGTAATASSLPSPSQPEASPRVTPLPTKVAPLPVSISFEIRRSSSSGIEDGQHKTDRR